MGDEEGEKRINSNYVGVYFFFYKREIKREENKGREEGGREVMRGWGGEISNAECLGHYQGRRHVCKSEGAGMLLSVYMHLLSA